MPRVLNYHRDRLPTGGSFRANADMVHVNESELADAEYARKVDELDRLLNDPAVPMEPAKVWSLLLAEIAQQDRRCAQDAEPGR